jgi:hypothetical protein
LAQALHDRVIVQQNHGLVLSERRDRLIEARRQIKALALPIPRQILRATLDAAIGLDEDIRPSLVRMNTAARCANCLGDPLHRGLVTHHKYVATV